MRQPARITRPAWLSGLGIACALGVLTATAQQPPAGTAPKFATPTPQVPLFFREEWRQTTPFDATTNYEPERGITPKAVTNTSLELKLYDPRAAAWRGT